MSLLNTPLMKVTMAAAANYFKWSNEKCEKVAKVLENNKELTNKLAFGTPDNEYDEAARKLTSLLKKEGVTQKQATAIFEQYHF